MNIIIFMFLFFSCSEKINDPELEAENFFPKTYGGNNDELAVDIDLTQDGDYIFIGDTKSFGNYNSSGYSDFTRDWWVVKITETGEEIWNKTYNGTVYDDMADFIVTYDNNYIIGGSERRDQNSTTRTNVIMKIDFNGEVLWKKDYDYLDMFDCQVLSDGQLLCLGIKQEDNSFSKYPCIYKMDIDGNELWSKMILNEYFSGVFSIISLQDNSGYVITGNSGNDPVDVWLAKLNLEGNIVWEKTFGGSNGEDTGYSVIEVENSNLLVIASNNSSSGPVSAWLIKTDSEGNQIWNRTYGGNENSHAYAAIYDNDNSSYVFTGSVQSDVWVVKTDLEGNEIWSKMFDGSTNLDSGKKIILNQNGEYVILGQMIVNANDGFGQENISSDIALIVLDVNGELR